MTVPESIPQPNSPHFEYGLPPEADFAAMDSRDSRFGNPQAVVAEHNGKHYIQGHRTDKQGDTKEVWTVASIGSKAEEIVENQPKAEARIVAVIPESEPKPDLPPFDYAPAGKPVHLDGRKHNFGNPEVSSTIMDKPHFQVKSINAKTGERETKLAPAKIKPGSLAVANVVQKPAAETTATENGQNPEPVKSESEGRDAAANEIVGQEGIDSYLTEALKNFRQEQEALAQDLVDQFPGKVSGRPRYFQETIGSQLAKDYGGIMDASFSLYKNREMNQDNPDIFDKLALALDAAQVWRLRKAERVDQSALWTNVSELLDQLASQELPSASSRKASGALKMLMDFGCFDLAHSGSTFDIERAINFIQSYSAAHPELDVNKLDIDVAQEAIKYHAASMAADATRRVDLVEFDKEKRAKLDALADTTFRLLAPKQRKAA